MNQQQTVINPFTGRRIVVGGRAYKLVEESLINWLRTGCSTIRDPNQPRIYCGNRQQVPREYMRRGTQYECLRKGYGSGKCSVYNKFNA